MYKLKYFIPEKSYELCYTIHMERTFEMNNRTSNAHENSILFVTSMHN